MPTTQRAPATARPTDYAHRSPVTGETAPWPTVRADPPPASAFKPEEDPLNRLANMYGAAV